MTASTEDERELIEAAQADPARFVEVYDRYVDRVYAYVSRRRQPCRCRRHCSAGSASFNLSIRLPDLQRRVIEMRFVEDKSVRDVAALLDRTEGAVKQLQFRAIENLRKGMGLP